MEIYNYLKDSEVFKSVINGSLSKKATILMHKNADADCVGASLALSLLLEKLGFECKIVSSNGYSSNFRWMPNIDKVVIFDSIFKGTIIDYISSCDIVFCLDFSQSIRIDSNIVGLLDGKKVCIIDHHPDQPDFVAVNILNSLAASTCEIIYELISLSYSEMLDKSIAECLYAGILSDTGHFITQNMTYRVHEIASDLLKRFNLDVHIINKNLFGSNRFARMRFLGHVLSRCLKIVPDYCVAYIVLTQEDTSKFYLKPGETDGIVNYALAIENIEVAALLNEKKDGVYISLRSVGDFSVSEFAKKHFNGGGHNNAAGGFSKKSIDETLKNFIDYISAIDSLRFNRKINLL